MDKQKLQQLEAKCLQECAPPCAAACPVHVDCRGLAGLMARGDHAGAVKLLRKAIPFPAVIGSICDQPCKSACNRGRLGGAIEMASLELAAARFGEAAPPRIPILPARGKNVAIAGGGLSGLTAAFELRKKGYGVTVFEATDRLGGSIWKSLKLRTEDAERDFSVLAAMGIDLRLQTPADPENLPGFDAVYVATGSGYSPVVDPVTYATGQNRVFAGGSLLRAPENHSSILSVSDGRRAAVSIDRYLQAASLTAARSGEGSFESCLYTSLASVRPSEAVIAPQLGYSSEQARQEAGRCLQCQCLECVKACRYLESYGGYPKKYVREIYNNLSIVMGVRQSNTLTNSCSLCGLCAEVCPNDLSMAQVCADARRTMVSQKRMPPSAHDFALRDMLFACSPACSLACPAPGAQSCDYVFFPGCQLAASAPEHVVKTYALLQEKLQGSVGLLLRCCGTPADWAGRDDLLGQALDEFKKELHRLGSPRVILACPSCSRVFDRHLPDIATASLWELLAKEEPGPAAGLSGRTLSIHDPCAARHDAAVHASIRRMAENLGATIEELALGRQKTTCCSFGGLQWFANNKLAHEVLERRLRESDRDYLTYCSMCRDLFVSQGKRCLHLLDLLFEPDFELRATRPCPGWSQRRENRIGLKAAVLKKYWNKEPAAEPDGAAIRLSISPDVRAILEQRLILDDDIRQVIAQAEKTGRRLRHHEAGRYLAYHKTGSVTYWVEYRPAETGYAILNACSHRMDIVSEKITPGAKPGAAEKPPWLCDCCGSELAQANVEIAYLGSAFPVELFCCSACRMVFIPEELVLTRMAGAEKILEDK